jgi:hypothetical protein
MVLKTLQDLKKSGLSGYYEISFAEPNGFLSAQEF